MATASQVAAARKANEAYKAAQASGDSAAAKNVISGAASSLGVSNSAYSSAMANVDKTFANLQNQQQNLNNPNLQNLNNINNQQQKTPIQQPKNSIYGDTNVDFKAPQYQGQGAKLSTGEEITDLGAFGGQADDYYRFGKGAKEIQLQDSKYIETRNDVLAMDILKNNPAITAQNADKIILDYIKTKDTKGELYTGDRGETDVANTVNKIKSRMGYIPSAEDRLAKEAENLYDKEIGDIKSQYEAEKNAFYRAGGVEDRYSNFNEVNDRVNRTLEEAGRHRMENLYTGMPTDQDLREIASNLGQDFATTKKIMEGRGFEDLEMQDEFKELSERPYERAFEDIQRQKDRDLQDLQLKHERTQTALNEQIDDVETQMERSIAIGEKAGALSGGIKSSGYRAGLENIRNDAIKNMDRLSTRKDWDTSDTVMIKGRIIDDFNTAMERTKEDLDQAMNDIKTNNGAALNQYLNQYSPSSTELSRKLGEIEDYFGIKSQEAFSKYTANLRGITDTMTYNTEKYLQIEGMKQQLQQTNVKNMLANNGAALAGISFGDLQGMLQSGDISPTDYISMVGNMKTLGISTLQGIGAPNPQDLALYDQMLEQGMTPQQAISAVVSANPGRFGEYGSVMSGNIGGYGEVPINYNIATPSDLMEGGVFLDKYKEGANAPRNGYCGQFVNDYLKSMNITDANLFKDPITEKTQYVNSQTPKVGSVMIMDSKTSPQHGHVAVVEGINADGTIKIKEANWNGDGKIHTRTVDPNNMGVNVYGYFDPTLQGGFEQKPTVNYLDELGPFYNRFLSTESKNKLTSEDWKTIDSMGISRQQFTQQAMEYKKVQDQEMSGHAAELIELLQKLEGLSKTDFNNMRINMPTTKGRDLKAIYDRVIASVSLQKLIDLKSQGATFGALSDNELNFITNASNNLRLRGTKDAFDTNLEKMINTLKKGVGTTEKGNTAGGTNTAGGSSKDTLGIL